MIPSTIEFGEYRDMSDDAKALMIWLGRRFIDTNASGFTLEQARVGLSWPLQRIFAAADELYRRGLIDRGPQ